jgi:predicted ATPase
MEEMVQALFEQGVPVHDGSVILAQPLDDIRVPATAQAILASRIDRLSPGEKKLLQTLAVLGREFPSSLIRSVTGKPDAELERMLSELQLGEFIYEQAAISDIEYAFKHALTQELHTTRFSLSAAGDRTNARPNRSKCALPRPAGGSFGRAGPSL